MTRLPTPRGFWDYALFALFMTGLLLFAFWSRSPYRIGWADAVFALVVAVLMVLGIVLARRREKAEWIKQPTWRTFLIAYIAVFALFCAADYADLYLLHGTTIASRQLRHDLILSLVLSAVLTWQLRRRSRATSQLS